MPGPTDDRPADGERSSGAVRWPDDETFSSDIPGTEEVPVVNWPLIWRARLGDRVRESDRYRWWVLWAALTGNFAFGFTITILAVSVPTIAADLGGRESSLTWIVTGPLLTFALATPLFGKLGDVFGHRRVYLAGFAAFSVVAVLTAVAWDPASLIGFRVLGALAGSATGPSSMALIMRAYPESDRVKAMGWWSLVGAGAPVIGLVAGGPVVDTFGWRWIFVAQAPVSMLAVVLASVVLHETPRRSREPIDFAGAALLAASTITALLALQRGGGEGWLDPVALGLLAAVPPLLYRFVRTEQRASHPLLPLGFFRRPNFTVALVALFAANFAYMGGFIVTPRLVQGVFGLSVATTAYVMLFRPLTFSVTAPIAGYLAVRVGERVTSVAGTVFVVLSMVALAIGARTEVLAFVFAGLVLSGLGLGVASPSLTSSIANAVDASDLGVANAAQAMVSQIGVVAGMQILTTVSDSGRGGAPFANAYLVGGAVAVVSIFAAWALRSADRSGSVEVGRAA